MPLPIVLIVVFGVVAGVMSLIAWRSYRRVPAGTALVISGRETAVAFTGRIVWPIVQHAEEIDLSVHRIEIERRGKDGVICADSIRADLIATFFVRINRTVEDVLRVAQSVGCRRASALETLEDLFSAKFSEAIKTVAKQLDFETLFTHREQFKDKVLEVIGRDLNGFVLDDAAIDSLEQTPIEVLDPMNVLDAQGIKKIRALAAAPYANNPRGGPHAAARSGNTRPERELREELGELGLLDVRVSTSVSCDVPATRAAITLALGDADARDKLPESVSRATLAAIGPAQLTCEAGSATVVWSALAVSREQLVAAARLVHALREDDQAYR